MSVRALRPKTRLVVMTDISTLTADQGEPDDTQSLVRLLHYSNDFDIEGLIATHTSAKVPRSVNPQFIRAILDEYGKVQENLALHDPRYPSAASLKALVKAGSTNRSAVGEGHDTEASDWIIKVVDRPDPRPVWFSIWGGARELAQALWKVDQTRLSAERNEFESRIRVYATYDQDGTGKWIAEHHPSIFYITGCDTVRGMYRDGDTTLTGPEWVEQHVRQGHGALGAAYPNYHGGDPWGRVYGMKEGDTPAFLYLIPNGLGSPERPELGSWGGRFEGPGPRYHGAKDTWNGEASERATVFRWREAYQNSFATRLDWCVRKPQDANHEPVGKIAGEVERTTVLGARMELDGSPSHDPDGDKLSYQWQIYPVGAGKLEPEADPKRAIFTAREPGVTYILLAVKDSGNPPLSAYSRVTIHVQPGPV
ncbi:MAG: nucleoside hydrolase-like domain-containing protein [Terriglobia bacterium]